MNIGNRIKEVRGTTPREEFAALFGVNKATIQRYEIYGRDPGTEFITNLCERYGINAEWILFGSGQKYRGGGQGQQSSGQDQDPFDFDYIPMVEPKLSAGGGAFVESEGVRGYYAFRKDWLHRVTSSSKDLVLMRVIGDSMAPTIQENDTVMVDTGRRDISEGKVYAIRYDQTIMIKRLVFRPAEKILVISDNRTEYEPYEAAMTDLHIIGQIIFFSRVLIPE